MSLDLYKHIYLIGVGGIGMSALARYFNAKGKRVYGYEINHNFDIDYVEDYEKLKKINKIK